MNKGTFYSTTLNINKIPYKITAESQQKLWLILTSINHPQLNIYSNQELWFRSRINFNWTSHPSCAISPMSSQSHYFSKLSHVRTSVTKFAGICSIEIPTCLGVRANSTNRKQNIRVIIQDLQRSPTAYLRIAWAYFMRPRFKHKKYK